MGFLLFGFVFMMYWLPAAAVTFGIMTVHGYYRKNWYWKTALLVSVATSLLFTIDKLRQPI